MATPERVSGRLKVAVAAEFVAPKVDISSGLSGVLLEMHPHQFSAEKNLVITNRSAAGQTVTVSVVPEPYTAVLGRFGLVPVLERRKNMADFVQEEDIMSRLTLRTVRVRGQQKGGDERELDTIDSVKLAASESYRLKLRYSAPKPDPTPCPYLEAHTYSIRELVDMEQRDRDVRAHLAVEYPESGVYLPTGEALDEVLAGKKVSPCTMMPLTARLGHARLDPLFMRLSFGRVQLGTNKTLVFTLTNPTDHPVKYSILHVPAPDALACALDAGCTLGKARALYLKKGKFGGQTYAEKSAERRRLMEGSESEFGDESDLETEREGEADAEAEEAEGALDLADLETTLAGGRGEGEYIPPQLLDVGPAVMPRVTAQMVTNE
ncbi:hypothetical protein KIPB_012411, partial [Kipferlia bialata]|eukprot:g12411.t1